MLFPVVLVDADLVGVEVPSAPLIKILSFESADWSVGLPLLS